MGVSLLSLRFGTPVLMVSLAQDASGVKCRVHGGVDGGLLPLDVASHLLQPDLLAKHRHVVVYVLISIPKGREIYYRHPGVETRLPKCLRTTMT